MSKTYTVFLNAFGSLSIEVEASTPEEAAELAYQVADINDCSCYDWDYESDVEIKDSEDKYHVIKNN